MSSSKPTILLVHGAWHRPSHYALLTDALKASGFGVIAPPNTTAGSPDAVAGKTHIDDVQVLHAAISPHINAGEEVVVVCHSYGGVPATASLEGHTVEERAKMGVNGGIKAIVYIAAFAVPQRGLSAWDLGGNQYADIWDVQENYVGPTPAFENLLFQGAELGIPLPVLVKQSRASLETPTQFVAADSSIPKTYVICENDKALPPEAQLEMARAAGAEVVRTSSGHSPHLNKQCSEELVKIIAAAAQ